MRSGQSSHGTAVCPPLADRRSPLIYNRGQCPEPTLESANSPAAALLLILAIQFQESK